MLFYRCIESYRYLQSYRYIQFLIPVIALVLLFLSSKVSAETDDLFELAETVVAEDQLLSQQRQQLFQLAYQEQLERLRKSERRLALAEREQTRLKQLFAANEGRLAELETALAQRSDGLGEVFGVAKEQANELQSLLQNSLTSIDFPERDEALAFAQSKRVPSIKDFKALLNLHLAEMKSAGEIKSINTLVTDENGHQDEQEVLLFGMFAAATLKGDYLAWNDDQRAFETLGTQPGRRAPFSNIQNQDHVTVWLDPSRGELFELLGRIPGTWARIKQGGTVGYLILFLGVVGLAVAFYQLLRLTRTEWGVRQQLLNLTQLSETNPLGRVLKAGAGLGDTVGIEQIEMRVDEAILKELPHIEQGQSFLKLLAAVAPLLGLLGTVVGMIATFQSITLFGTSDPKLMASGISQALITTVMGLVVAVPVLFCHSFLLARGRRLVQILQEKGLATLTSGHCGLVEGSLPEKQGSGGELHVA